jgi:hypothetical protein
VPDRICGSSVFFNKICTKIFDSWIEESPEPDESLGLGGLVNKWKWSKNTTDNLSRFGKFVFQENFPQIFRYLRRHLSNHDGHNVPRNVTETDFGSSLFVLAIRLSFRLFPMLEHTVSVGGLTFAPVMAKGSQAMHLNQGGGCYETL